MSDGDRLRQSLGKLMTPGESVGGRRRLHGPGPEALVTAILCEIDETVLARALVFEADDGRTLCLEAYNRRFIRLVSAEPAPPEGLAGQMLATADEAELLAVRDSLLAFVAGTTTLMVGSTPPRGKIAATDLGPTATVLARLWQISKRGAPDGALAAETFLKSVNAAATAWLWISPKGVRSSAGDAPTVERLNREAAAGAFGFARPDGNICQVTSLDTARTALLARIGGHVILAELPADRSDEILENWRLQGF